MVNNILLFFKKHKHEVILCCFFLAYLVYFTTASFLKYTNFYTGRFDLGNMDQTVWNTLHGRIFQLTNPDGTNIIYRLAFHADFILVLLAPFYLIWQDPRTLLFIQTAVLAVGCFFVYLIAKELLKNKTVSLLLAICFLFNPSLEFSNLYDFHAVTLATTFLLAAFYFLLTKKYSRYVLFLILAAITKEQIWLITALFGIYTFFFTKKRKLGVFITIFSAILFYYIFTIAIPQARGGQHFALVYYSDLGSSPATIVESIFLSPQKIASLIFTKAKFTYLYEIFFPVGFLCFLAPIFLIFTGPDFAINLLSNNTQFHQIYYQYTAVITSFVFIATIYGMHFLTKRFKKIKLIKISYFIAATTFIAAYTYGPLPGARYPDIDMFTKPLPYAQSIDAFLNTIPKQYSVAATNNIGSHLSHREKIFTIPTGVDEADILVFLLNDKFAQPSLAAQKEMVEKLQHNKHYVELFHHEDFVVFKKKSDTLARLQSLK